MVAELLKIAQPGPQELGRWKLPFSNVQPAFCSNYTRADLSRVTSCQGIAEFQTSLLNQELWWNPCGDSGEIGVKGVAHVSAKENRKGKPSNRQGPSMQNTLLAKKSVGHAFESGRCKKASPGLRGSADPRTGGVPDLKHYNLPFSFLRFVTKIPRKFRSL